MPNGANVEFFSMSLSPDTKIPEDLAKIPSPRVGLIGHITVNVDLEIIEMMAAKHAEWSIVMIGQIKVNGRLKRDIVSKKLWRFPNVHFLGLKPYESLPMYQKGIDVCLLPYKLNEFNKYVYPNKIHQHLAGGKPIVSTDLPEIRPFANVIYIAKSKEEFMPIPNLERLTPLQLAPRNSNFDADQKGYFKIWVSHTEKKIIVSHYLYNDTINLLFESESAEALSKEIAYRKLISSLEHAIYLGRELEKAEICLKLGKSFIQDDPIW